MRDDSLDISDSETDLRRLLLPFPAHLPNMATLVPPAPVMTHHASPLLAMSSIGHANFIFILAIIFLLSQPVSTSPSLPRPRLVDCDANHSHHYITSLPFPVLFFSFFPFFDATSGW